MREIRYFGLNRWDEMRWFMLVLREGGKASNIVVRVDSSALRYIVEWDEASIDLENK